MKQASLGGLSLLAVLLLIGLIEAFRNKGGVVIHGTAIESNRIVKLNLHIRNNDWRVPLAGFSIQMDVGNDWNVISAGSPLNDEMRSDVYGPNSEWKSVTMGLKDSVVLKAGKEVQFDISLSRQAGSTTNVVNGDVSYLGAVIWEKVGKGQRNTEYFAIPVTTTP